MGLALRGQRPLPVTPAISRSVLRGFIIAGVGTNPSGLQEAFLVDLDPTPQPNNDPLAVDDAAAVRLPAHSLELFRRGRLDEELITFHCASSP